MYNSVSDDKEYTPLQGSGPRKSTAYLIAGGTTLLVFGLFAALAGPSAPVAVAGVAALNAQVPAADVGADAAAQTQFPETTAMSVASADGITYSVLQYDLIYNILSFAVACMGSATVFFFFQFSLVHKSFRTAMIITGLVTLIAFYHYIRIFNSFNEAYVNSGGVITATGVPFNDAYRYVDWLLTVPLLLIELILVMKLDEDTTREQCIKLGSSAAIMVILGYPGEISDSMGTRWTFWVLAMIPFLFIVYTLFFGLRDSIESQPKEARELVRSACWVTVLSWCTYPLVYIFPMIGLTGAAAHTAIQLGYSVADVVAKPLLGLLVWKIAAAKSASVAIGEDM